MNVQIALRQARGAGRPRQFDMDEALDAALIVFRERGFAAASVGELGKAMKLAPGSLYKAFPDKRSLFLAALNRYASQRSSQLLDLIGKEVSAVEKIRAVMTFFAESSHGLEGRRGCLVVSGLEELSILEDEIAAAVTAASGDTQALIEGLVRAGQQDGTVTRAQPAQVLATSLFAFVQGLRVVGKLGRQRDAMLATVDVALVMLAIPSPHDTGVAASNVAFPGAPP